MIRDVMVTAAEATVASAVISALAAIGAVAWTIADRRAQAREKREDEAIDEQRRNDPELARMEKEAYERARASYEAALRTLRSQSTELEERLTRVEARARRAEEAADNAVARAEAAEAVSRRQGRTLDALRAWLRENGIQIPAHLDGDTTPPERHTPQ